MNKPNYNWSDIAVFLAVLRAGSTLAASKELGMSQPTVGRRIEALEHALGLTLFSRDTRGFRPTAVATKLAAAARGVDAATAAFSEEAILLKQAEAGPIRITAPPNSLTPDHSAILEEFRAAHPEVRFEFIMTNQPLDLSAGAADIAFRFAQHVEDQSLICRRISEITSGYYASHSYVEKSGCPRDEDELSGHRFVVYQGENTPRAANDWLLNCIESDEIVTTCADIGSMVMVLKSGAGIGPLPTAIGEADEMLVRCFDAPASTAVTLWMLASPIVYRRPEVKAFFAFFAPRYAATFKRMQQSDRGNPQGING